MDVLDLDATRKSYRRDAALDRLVPPLAGLVAAVVTVIVAPRHGTQSFFSTAAQIAPVPLLALAIEAKVLDRAQLHGSKFARNIELGRRIGDAGTLIVVAIGAYLALTRLSNDKALQCGANWVLASLAWGFVTVAALALTGSPQPRLTATITKRWHNGRNHNASVEVGVGNEYGDTTVIVRLNLMLEPEHRVDKTGADDTYITRLPQMEGKDKLEPDGEEVPVEWVSVKDIELPPGETSIMRFTITNVKGATPIRAKFTNHLLPDGEVNAYRVL